MFRYELAAKSVLIHCDNLAVVHTLNSGRAWDEYLGTIARNIWLLTASFDIDLTVVHIPGADNRLADELSRWFSGSLSQIAFTNLLTYDWILVLDEHLLVNNII